MYFCVDLQKFLSMKAEVDKSEKENRELQQQYRLQEETDRKRENEAYNKLLEAEQWLGQLEKKKSAMDKQLQDEINKLVDLSNIKIIIACMYNKFDSI